MLTTDSPKEPKTLDLQMRMIHVCGPLGGFKSMLLILGTTL